jgi:hypothetical protein
LFPLDEIHHRLLKMCIVNPSHSNGSNKGNTMTDHIGHVITNRFSGDYCDTCERAIEHDPTRCHNCGGTGTCYRWSNAYHGRGKAYNCGKCKGTGVTKPAPCHDCGQPAGIRSGKYTENLPVAYCGKCYESRIVGGIECHA